MFTSQKFPSVYQVSEIHHGRQTQAIPLPIPLSKMHRHSRRGHGDSGISRAVAGRAINARRLRLLGTRVISVASWLRRYWFIVVFDVIKFEFFPLFIGNWLTLTTAEITTKETTAAEVTARDETAEHKQRLFEKEHAHVIIHPVSRVPFVIFWARFLERWLTLNPELSQKSRKVLSSKNMQLEVTKYCRAFTTRNSNGNTKFYPKQWNEE